MRKIIYTLSLLLFVSACDNAENIPNNAVSVSDAYTFVTPASFPAAAVFMTVTNTTDTADKMVAFETERGTRSELHTMEMSGDVMRMRSVDGYEIAAGTELVLKPGAEHIMVFGIDDDLQVGDKFEGRVLFESAAEVPVTIEIRERPTTN